MVEYFNDKSPEEQKEIISKIEKDCKVEFIFDNNLLFVEGDEILRAQIQLKTLVSLNILILPQIRPDDSDLELKYPEDYPWENLEELEEKGKIDPIELDPNTVEYNFVLNKFLDTISNKQGYWREGKVIITSIKRIQNKNLYERYYFSKLRITNKLEKLKSAGKNINPYKYEVLGFHGTRTADPSLIYNSYEGIDRRFTTTGYYGMGTYFAVQASYS